MFRLRKRTRWAVSVGLAACAVLFASAYPGGGEASLSKATAPSLGAATSFAVLAGSAITNTGSTVIDGGIGSYPTTTITGFPPGTVNGTNHGGDGVTQQAKTDLAAAYATAAGQTPAIVGAELGGTTLTPGVYKSAAGAFGITGTLTLNGDANAVWIFQMDSTLVTASGSSVSLIGGASDCNVFWQAGSSATLGTGSTLRGNILASASITLTTGARVYGRALAQNGAVTLDTNRVDASVCGAPAPTAVPATATATATGTATAVPATATGTATVVPATATATATGTATAFAPTGTATVVPATATATATGTATAFAHTATATAVPPTATATSAPTRLPTAAPADSGDDSPASQPVPTSTPVPVPTPVPAVVLAPVKASGVEIAPSTPIQIVALPAGTVLQPGEVALPIGALIVVPSQPELGPLLVEAPIPVELAEEVVVPELGPVLVEAPILVELPEEVVMPAPGPARPPVLPNSGDAGSPIYGWWMVAGLILSIAGYFFRRAGRRL